MSLIISSNTFFSWSLFLADIKILTQACYADSLYKILFSSIYFQPVFLFKGQTYLKEYNLLFFSYLFWQILFFKCLNTDTFIILTF